MRISKFNNERVLNCPVFGSGSDILAGALLKRGPTPGTNNGELIQADSNTTAAADALGILMELHDYSVTGDNLIAGTNFVTHKVELLSPARIVRAEYQLSSAGTGAIACTQAVSTTTLTLTSLEDDIDAAFLYVVGGTGAGQTNYLTASAAGSCTLKAAFGTNLDTTSYLVKILPRFHQFAGLSSDGTKLATYAAVGVHTVIVLDSYIVRNGRVDSLDPTKHAALTGLNSIRSLRFEADLMFRNTIPASID
jgi:hypothetical protein